MRRDRSVGEMLKRIPHSLWPKNNSSLRPYNQCHFLHFKCGLKENQLRRVVFCAIGRWVSFVISNPKPLFNQVNQTRKFYVNFDKPSNPTMPKILRTIAFFCLTMWLTSQISKVFHILKGLLRRQNKVTFMWKLLILSDVERLTLRAR